MTKSRVEMGGNASQPGKTLEVSASDVTQHTASPGSSGTGKSANVVQLVDRHSDKCWGGRPIKARHWVRVGEVGERIMID